MGVKKAPRPRVEQVENRLLLSGYALSAVGYPGANATGNTPDSTLVADAAGNLYGTTTAGGACNLLQRRTRELRNHCARG